MEMRLSLSRSKYFADEFAKIQEYVFFIIEETEMHRL